MSTSAGGTLGAGISGWHIISPLDTFLCPWCLGNNLSKRLFVLFPRGQSVANFDRREAITDRGWALGSRARCRVWISAPPFPLFVSPIPSLSHIRTPTWLSCGAYLCADPVLTVRPGRRHLIWLSFHCSLEWKRTVYLSLLALIKSGTYLSKVLLIWNRRNQWHLKAQRLW